MPFAILSKSPPGRSPMPTIPVLCVQRYASIPEAEYPPPAITDPSAEAAAATLSPPPGIDPKPTLPPAAVQRNDSEFHPPPTITIPSPETPYPSPPGGTPTTGGNAVIPVAAVQRNGPCPVEEKAVPATTEPSPETPQAVEESRRKGSRVRET
jgi:hypothetical protein